MSLGISSSVSPTASSAEILAIGNPVALLASAEERETRGFISITRISPVSRMHRELDVRAAGLDLDRADHAQRRVAHVLVAAVRQRLRRRDGDAVAGVDAHRVEVLDRAHDDQLSARSRMTSSSNSFQPIRHSSTSTALDGLAASSPRVTVSSSSARSNTVPEPSPPTVWAEEELEHAVTRGLAASPVKRVLLEEYLEGWQEFELEVMRDRKDNVVVVCSIENFDPMGIHTGDSITVAPAQTLSDRDYQHMRDAAQRIMRAIQVDAGGSNIQFAVHPRDGRMRVIEMNPRVSRSSALASKATGFPIAKISALLAVGYTLDEIPNDITKKTPASFEPALDYCVVKIPRWAFEKFPAADPVLGTRMKSVGEVMAIGRTFPEALLKGLRSLELDGGQKGLGSAAGEEDLTGAPRAAAPADLAAHPPGVGGARRGRAAHGGEPLHGHRSVVPAPDPACHRRRERDRASWARSTPSTRICSRAPSGSAWETATCAQLTGSREKDVRERRYAIGLRPVYKAVDTCAAEFDAETPYFYSTYEEENEARPGKGQKVIILGSGPNRIGQGIEFDYCCVQAALALRAAGYEVVLVNSNPETVSTDYDISTRLYFEPLTLEDVLHIVDHREADGGDRPARRPDAAQAGARARRGRRAPVGHDVRRHRPGREPRPLRRRVRAVGLQQPANATAATREEALAEAQRLGYPVLARPSYVLGGRGMRVVYDPEQLAALLEDMPPSAEEPVLLDEFLEGAIEVDVDARGRRAGGGDRRRASSTSRRPASTPATPRASSRRTRWARRWCSASTRRRARWP